MLKVNHKCGYSKEFEFLCPQCNLPFCEEDTMQAVGGLLVNSVKTGDELNKQSTKITNIISQLEIYKTKINQIVDWCNAHKRPHETDIEHL